jgi:hypothetical protein
MKSFCAGATALALLLPVSAMAQAKPDIIVITKTAYTCKTCTPAFTVKPDGQAYPVKGANYDAVAVRLTSNGDSELRMKGGKVVVTINTSVSADGRTASIDFTDNSGPKPLRGFAVARRVEGSAKGDNPASGSWQVADSSGAKLSR